MIGGADRKSRFVRTITKELDGLVGNEIGDIGTRKIWMRDLSLPTIDVERFAVNAREPVWMLAGHMPS
jgi:hypothetical protein